MKLFGQIIRTVINTVALPIAFVKDIATLGGVVTEKDEPYTVVAVKKLKDEASEDA